MQTLYASSTAWRKLIDPLNEYDLVNDLIVTNSIGVEVPGYSTEEGVFDYNDNKAKIVWTELGDKVIPATYPSDFDLHHLKFLHENGYPNAERDENGTWSFSLEEVVTEALYQAFPKAMELMALFTSYAEVGTKYIEWTMPDNFIARSNNKVQISNTIGINVKCFNSTEKDISFNQEILINPKREVVAPNIYSRATSPSIIHSLDGYAVRKISNVFKELNKPLSAVHDDFLVLPEDADLLRSVYATTIIEILDNRFLEKLVKEIHTNLDIPQMSQEEINKLYSKNPFTEDEVRKAMFILS